jgi:hypothetical protein
MYDFCPICLGVPECLQLSENVADAIVAKSAMPEISNKLYVYFWFLFSLIGGGSQYIFISLGPSGCGAQATSWSCKLCSCQENAK